MKILSIDTASDICGVSIIEDKNLIINLDCNTGRTHSENLMPMIKNAFLKSNLNLKNIDLIVCDIGPRIFYRYKNWYCNSSRFPRQPKYTLYSELIH